MDQFEVSMGYPPYEEPPPPYTPQKPVLPPTGEPPPPYEPNVETSERNNTVVLDRVHQNDYSYTPQSNGSAVRIQSNSYVPCVESQRLQNNAIDGERQIHNCVSSPNFSVFQVSNSRGIQQRSTFCCQCHCTSNQISRTEMLQCSQHHQDCQADQEVEEITLRGMTSPTAERLSPVGSSTTDLPALAPMSSTNTNTCAFFNTNSLRNTEDDCNDTATVSAINFGQFYPQSSTNHESTFVPDTLPSDSLYPGVHGSSGQLYPDSKKNLDIPFCLASCQRTPPDGCSVGQKKVNSTFSISNAPSNQSSTRKLSPAHKKQASSDKSKCTDSREDCVVGAAADVENDAQPLRPRARLCYLDDMDITNVRASKNLARGRRNDSFLNGVCGTTTVLDSPEICGQPVVNHNSSPGAVQKVDNLENKSPHGKRRIRRRSSERLCDHFKQYGFVDGPTDSRGREVSAAHGGARKKQRSNSMEDTRVSHSPVPRGRRRARSNASERQHANPIPKRHRSCSTGSKDGRSSSRKSSRERSSHGGLPRDTEDVSRRNISHDSRANEYSERRRQHRRQKKLSNVSTTKV